MVEALSTYYLVPSHHLPPVACEMVECLSYGSGPVMAQAVQEEMDKMLGKSTLEIVKNLGPGYYNRLFLVQKMTGGWRPVINLSALSYYVTLTPFKSEMVSVLWLIWRRDMMFSIDLEDTYFQIPIHPTSQIYLQIAL